MNLLSDSEQWTTGILFETDFCLLLHSPNYTTLLLFDFSTGANQIKGTTNEKRTLSYVLIERVRIGKFKAL